MDESPSDEIDEIELRNTILYYNHEYKRKLELGKAVHKIVINDEVVEDELLPEHKEALDLHLKKSMETFPNNIELKPWQNELMKYIQPHDREIIWVFGKDGDEGKNWFQKYVKSVYGSRKVVSGMNIKNNSANIFQALRKCSIVTVDIFLCNLGKSKYKFDPINYDALESIKDGEALASKYDSQHLKI